MSTDRRELILQHIFTVLQGVTGVQTCYRNRDALPNDQRPSIVLMDGDEEPMHDIDRLGRLSTTPTRVNLKPEIWLALESEKPKNLTIGTKLNSFRVQVLAAVLNDSTLQTIVGTNGDINYFGCATDLGRNRTLDGEMGLMLGIRYVLRPRDLLA